VLLAAIVQSMRMSAWKDEVDFPCHHRSTHAKERMGRTSQCSLPPSFNPSAKHPSDMLRKLLDETKK
jgi:hypothetical protein